MTVNELKDKITELGYEGSLSGLKKVDLEELLKDLESNLGEAEPEVEPEPEDKEEEEVDLAEEEATKAPSQVDEVADRSKLATEVMPPPPQAKKDTSKMSKEDKLVFDVIRKHGMNLPYQKSVLAMLSEQIEIDKKHLKTFVSKATQDSLFLKMFPKGSHKRLQLAAKYLNGDKEAFAELEKILKD